MTHIPYSRHVGQARSHLHDKAPVNTCVEDGMDLWPKELGLPTLDTYSVTTAEQRARDGYHGWKYVDGTEGIQPGFYGDWKPQYLGSPTDRHVCVVESISGSKWRGIGAGGPTGTVWYQPKSEGMNPLSVLQGYFVPPTETKTATPAVVKPAAEVTTDHTKTYTVVKNDTVYGIAKKFKIGQQALLKANPRKAGAKRNADYHITSPSLIYIGQKLHIPT